MFKFQSKLTNNNVFHVKYFVYSFKVLTITLFFLINFNHSLNAKTSGNFLGIDLITSKNSFQNIQYFTYETEFHRHTNPSSTRSYGINYSYAFNYKNFFIAPGFVFENNRSLNHLNRQSNTGHLINNYGTSYNSIKKRYGIKFDVGYDLNDNIAVYATIGQALNYYKNYNSNIHLFKYDGKNYGRSEKPVFDQNPFSFSAGKKHSLFYGGGFKIRIKDNWYFNGEYSKTKLSTINHNLILKPLDGILIYPFEGKFNIDLSIFKVGLSYNF